MEALFEAVRFAGRDCDSPASEPEDEYVPSPLHYDEDDDEAEQEEPSPPVDEVIVSSAVHTDSRCDQVIDGDQRSASDVLVVEQPAPPVIPEESDEEDVYEMDSMHGGPPGSRGLTLRQMRTDHWLVDPSHARYNPSKPGAWANVKIMTSHNPHRKANQTHMCVAPMTKLALTEGGQPVVCGMTFTCALTTKSKTSTMDISTRGAAFTNSPAADHAAKYHSQRTPKKRKLDNVKLLAASIAGLPTQEEASQDPEKAEERNDVSDVMGRFIGAGMVHEAFKRGVNQKAMLCRWFVFSRQELTHNTFTCPDHKAVLKAGDANYAAFWPCDVNNWVVRSFHILMLMTAYTMNHNERFHGGNPYWQGIHDGVTVSHVKFQSFGAQMEFGGINWLLCIGFTHLTSGTGKDVANSFKQCMARIQKIRQKIQKIPARVDMEKSMGACMQDYAAAAVARLLQQAIENCDMHNCDKVLKYGISVDGVAGVLADPYPEAQLLVRAVEKAASYYTYDKRVGRLHRCCKTAGITPIFPDQDLNSTRMASFNGLNLSMLRLQKGLTIDYGLNPENSHKLTPDQFQVMAEIDALASITSESITRVQNEKRMNRAYRYVLHKHTESQMNGDTLDVLQLPRIGRQTLKNLPRRPVHRDNFTAMGSRIWDRCKTALEYRHNLPGAKLNDTDLLCTLLDIRTKNAPHLSDGEYERATTIFRKKYIEYAYQMDVYQREVERGGAAPEVPPPPPAPQVIPSPEGPSPAKRSRSGFAVGQNRVDPQPAPVNDSNAWSVARKLFHGTQFDDVYVKQWLGAHIDWKAEFPQFKNSTAANEELDMVYDLWDMDIAPYYHKLILDGKFGFIPKLALSILGECIAASYVERVNSGGKKILKVGRKLLGLNVCEMLVMLRMNADFYKYFEAHHGKLLIELVATICMDADLNQYFMANTDGMPPESKQM
jgi:hypothetical protein